MTRSRALKTLEIGTPIAALLLLVVELPTMTPGHALEMAFFAILAALAFRLRVRYAGNYLGVEAAALVPA
nr:hypothetical protein [Acidobacteriota bacterium]